MPSTNTVVVYSTESPLVQRENAANDALKVRYDALNEQFNKVEARLKELKPLYDVWVTYDQDQFENDTWWSCLGLFKIEGKWRLAYGVDNNYTCGESLPYDLKPIIECPISIRIRASKEVRNLHEEIISQKEKLLPEVEFAIKELNDYCNEV